MGSQGWDRHVGARTTAVIAAAALLLSGCTAVPASTVSSTGPADAATSKSPSTIAVNNDITPHAEGTTLPFECAGPIGAWTTYAELAGPNAIAVPGVMAISTSVIGANSIQWGGASYRGLQFAKVGLVLKAGATFTLSVPAEMKGSMKIGWSNSGTTLADRLIISGCTSAQADSEWLTYPGGFWLKAPGCVPLTVTQGASSKTIHIPVGKSCP